MIVAEGLDKHVLSVNEATQMIFGTEFLGTDDAEKEILENDFLQGNEFINNHRIHTFAVEEGCSRDFKSLFLSFNHLKLLQCHLLET